MLLRKITYDNSVRYIPRSEQTKEKENEPKKMESGSLPGKQNKNISQNNKISQKNFHHKDSNILKEY